MTGDLVADVVRHLVAVSLWAVAVWALVAGVLFTRRQERERREAEGRRRYPCSRGAAPRPRR